MIRCRHCGQMNGDEALFCRGCACSLDPGPAPGRRATACRGGVLSLAGAAAVSVFRHPTLLILPLCTALIAAAVWAEATDGLYRGAALLWPVSADYVQRLYGVTSLMAYGAFHPAVCPPAYGVLAIGHQLAEGLPRPWTPSPYLCSVLDTPVGWAISVLQWWLVARCVRRFRRDVPVRPAVSAALLAGLAPTVCIAAIALWQQVAGPTDEQSGQVRAIMLALIELPVYLAAGTYACAALYGGTHGLRRGLWRRALLSTNGLCALAVGAVLLALCELIADGLAGALRGAELEHFSLRTTIGYNAVLDGVRALGATMAAYGFTMHVARTAERLGLDRIESDEQQVPVLATNR